MSVATRYTANQIKKHNTKDSCWVIVNDKVYDITSFLADHPGGDEILLEFAGTDVTLVLGDINYHTHSDAAYDLLTEYYIGDALDQDEEIVQDLDVGSESATKKKYETKKENRDQEFLDLKKALFPQLWNATYSKDFYLEQVHKPRYTPYCVPYFDNPIMDKLSKTNWFVVPLIWLPFVGFQLYNSMNSANSTKEIAVQGFITGLLFWTLFEYVLHRFLFHLDDFVPDHPLALLVHFTLHGIHHHMPMDR
jgi:4-hydroxysphinganine ceramide fatty acyl 2-hydroxylase